MKKKGFLKTSEHEIDFELNIASIIDCFVVLIAFVLVSTSFFSIGIIDAEVSGANEVAETDPSDSLVIELRADHSIAVRSAAEGQGDSATIAAKGKNWDFDGLAESLHGMKEKTPAIRSAVLMADNSVAYRDVMATLEKAKGEIPSVNLGGF